jgi:hypothetical protein
MNLLYSREDWINHDGMYLRNVDINILFELSEFPSIFIPFCNII